MKQQILIAMLLALVIPGGGHFYLGRRSRAALFFIVVVLMFFMGLWLDGKLYVLESGMTLGSMAAAVSMGSGSLYFAALSRGPFGDPLSFTYEYGTAFTLTAGLMNLLLVLDSFDIAEKRKE